MARERVEITGQRFGAWEALHRSDRLGKAGSFWMCRCDCGRLRTERSAALRNGTTKRCKACSMAALNTRRRDCVGVAEMPPSGG